MREVGPHDRSKGSQARDCSLRIDVSHPKSPWGTRHCDSGHGDGAGLLGDRGNIDHMLHMWGPRGCGHLDNCGDRRRDG